VIPGVRTLVSIPAGLARMNFLQFLAATFIGAYVWCTLLIGAGYLLGLEWPMISIYVKRVFPFLVAGGLVAIAVYFYLTYRTRKLALVKTRSHD
jgi:membrane protein DedA with SNARE-associated domain